MAITQKEKIQLLKDFQKYYLVNTNMNFSGLCSALAWFQIECMLSMEEFSYLTKLIRKHKPKETYDKDYYWRPYISKPRITWIEERIKELEAKKINEL